MQITHEQQPIIDYQGRHLVVKAFAGCGKTSTLVAFAKQHPKVKMLYLAYNRAIRDEGSEKFPSNVTCKTSHQLAFPSFGTRLQHKLGNPRLTDIATLLNSRNWTLVRDAQAVLNAFLSSALSEISPVNALMGMPPEDYAEASEQRIEAALSGARQMWAAMIDPVHKFHCVHDAYLKLYQLSKPQLAYEVILFDEAQDSNPVTAAIVANQSARKIFVGDKWQQIYRWRGAENALDQQIEQGADVMHLSNSFRFGPMIAGVANAILKQQGETLPLVGLGPKDRVATKLPFGENQYTILNRTVVGVIMTAIDAVSRGQTVYWNGGIEAYQISDLEDLYQLKTGNSEGIKNKRLLGQFKSYDLYAEAAEETKDPEMLRMIRIIKEHPDVPRLIASLRRNSVADAAQADVTVSTVHRSKGLEWEIVMLDEDFPDIFDEEKMTPDKRVDELNLLYVGATRAKRLLVINEIIEAIIIKSHDEARKARASQGATA